MPRIYTSTSDPVDFCRRHFPLSEEHAFEKYGHLGDGPDGRGNCFGYDEDHPDYEADRFAFPYRCAVCQRVLRDADN